MHHCSELSSEICFVGIQCILYNYTSANLLCDCNLLIHTRKHFLQLFLLSHLYNFLLLVLVLRSLVISYWAAYVHSLLHYFVRFEYLGKLNNGEYDIKGELAWKQMER